ncbi:MAG: hypothetical protein RMK29_11990 [Myxococcales bacterium]|nr:hypothetical protein [Myxococcales bacterium]
MRWLTPLTSGVVALLVGCASAPRPVPVGGQPMATVEGAGIVLSVPRLDPSAYPDDMLEAAEAVFVAVENRSQVEILVDLADFQLMGPGGMSVTPVSPNQLAFSALVPGRPGPARRPSLLAEGAPVYAGPIVPVEQRVVPPPAPAVRAPVPPPAPSFRGGAGFVSPGFRAGWGAGVGVYRGGWGAGAWVGPPGWGSWWWGWYGPGWWGPGWWWYGPGWWGPGFAIRSRDDAIRFGLPAGRLPPGGRVAGFLYFPRRSVTEGTQLTLRWQVREAQSRNVLAELRVPLELMAD